MFGWMWRHKVWTVVIASLLGLSITPIIIVTRTWFIVHTDQRPTQVPTDYVLEEQTEGFTCGVHAVSTVYRAYGLDSEAERVRWRLGVDTKAVFWMGDSTGALHPDLWMVLAQDFFDVEAVDCGAADSWDKLLAHLNTGHPAILLIARRENGHLHWVTATGHEEDPANPDGLIVIYDPLFDAPYTESIDFMSDHIVSCVLVRPAAGGQQAMSSLAAHRAGFDELWVARGRIERLQE